MGRCKGSHIGPSTLQRLGEVIILLELVVPSITMMVELVRIQYKLVKDFMRFKTSGFEDCESNFHEVDLESIFGRCFLTTRLTLMYEMYVLEISYINFLK